MPNRISVKIVFYKRNKVIINYFKLTVLLGEDVLNKTEKISYYNFKNVSLKVQICFFMVYNTRILKNISEILITNTVTSTNYAAKPFFILNVK